MNQYIITEEEWLRVYHVLPEMAHDIHSRPYNPQAERERVLDSLVIWRSHKEYEMGAFYCGDDYAKAWKDEWKRIVELREGKDGE
jgi:hypothetical protein